MCDCDLPDVYDHYERKARKQHRCCECRGTINAGERYHDHRGIWNGEPGQFKICVDCEELRNEVYHATDCCVAFTMLTDEICEYNILELADRFDAAAKKRGGRQLSLVQ